MASLPSPSSGRPATRKASIGRRESPLARCRWPRYAVLVHALDPHRVAPQACDMPQHFRRGFTQRPAVMHVVAQGKRAVAVNIDFIDLDVGLAVAEVVLLSEQLADLRTD